MELLLLLVFQGRGHDSDSFVADGVTPQVQLSDRLTALKHALKLTQAFEADVVLFQSQHFEVALLPQGSAESQGTLREDAIAREPNLRDVLGVFKDFCDVAGSVGPNKVVRKVQLSQR